MMLRLGSLNLTLFRSAASRKWSHFYEYNNINEVMQTFSALMKHSVCVLFQSHSFQSIFFSSSFYALVSQAPNNPWIYKWESKSPESVFYFCIADFFHLKKVKYVLCHWKEDSTSVTGGAFARQHFSETSTWCLLMPSPCTGCTSLLERKAAP